MRGQLRAAGIRQDCNVYVDVHRRSVSAQHGDWYVLGNEIHFTYILQSYINLIKSVTSVKKI